MVECRTVFYSARKTSLCERALKKSFSEIELDMSDISFTADRGSLCNALTEAFTECNYRINILEYTDTLEEYMNMSRNWWKKYHCSNECIALYLGGSNYYIRTIPSLED